jgi:hypothetical protein
MKGLKVTLACNALYHQDQPKKTREKKTPRGEELFVFVSTVHIEQPITLSQSSTRRTQSRKAKSQ